MSQELIIPAVGESITEVRIGRWHKSEGDFVSIEEVLVEIETDKATVELPAPIGGILCEVLAPSGQDATVGEVIGRIEEVERPTSEAKETSQTPSQEDEHAPTQEEPTIEPRVMPSARRVLAEAGVPGSSVEGTGPGGRVLKEDAMRVVRKEPIAVSPPTKQEEAQGSTRQATATARSRPESNREESVVRMSPLRKAIAQNLVAAQQDAALLTTFNEVDMTAVIDLRRRYRKRFQESHGVKLGFMSFFVKASVRALQAVPTVNARVKGTSIVYRNYQDIGIAVGGGRGLVVPILRNAESLGFAEIERAIGDFAARARQNKIELSELTGGTFTITNGGVYGSLLSTPIVNPPQSGILGMHAIQDRPVAIDGKVEVRPMMYVALTYDHRIVDGREAVGFLGRIKDLVESPERIWLNV